MKAMTEEYGIVHKELEPYEVLGTRWLPYEDILKLKKNSWRSFAEEKLDSFFKIIIWFRILMYMKMLFSRWNLMEEKLTQNM